MEKTGGKSYRMAVFCKFLFLFLLQKMKGEKDLEKTGKAKEMLAISVNL